MRFALTACHVIPDAPSRWRQEGSFARRKALGCLGAAAWVMLSGCATKRLDADWLETEALVASRDRHGDYVRVAQEMMVRSEYDLALRAYTRAIQEVGLTGPIIGGIGAANAQLERTNQAHRYLDRGTKIAPQSVSVWNNLGVVLSHMGDMVAGRAAFGVAAHVGQRPDPVIAANIEVAEGSASELAPDVPHLALRHSSGLYLIVKEAPAYET